jgi:hypothetical protein
MREISNNLIAFTIARIGQLVPQILEKITFILKRYRLVTSRSSYAFSKPKYLLMLCLAFVSYK